MDWSNHPAMMVLSIVVVSSLLSEIRISVRIPLVAWEILLGHDSRPRSSWSGKHFTRRIGRRSLFTCSNDSAVQLLSFAAMQVK